jgi:HK97 family phage major capsid protein
MRRKPIFQMDNVMAATARRARNDGGNVPDDPKKAVDELMRAFEEFKQANDANLKQRDTLLDEKINKISTALDKFEPMNQKLTLAEQQAKAMQEQLDRVETILNRPDLPGGKSDREKENAEYKAAFDRVMRKHADGRDPQDVAIIQKRMASLVRGDDVSAGYLLAPPEMQAEILKDIVEITPMRSIATVRTIGTGSLKQPKKTGHTTATRVGETQTRTNTGDPTYGMIEIPAPEMFTRVEVSQQMLEDSAYDLMAELREDSAEQFAYKEGYEYINGLGAANQAEGILTNISIAEVVSGAAAAITADGLIKLWEALKSGYGRNALYGLNRSTIGAIRKLKTGDGQYMWVPGIANAVPNTINGSPYIEMPDMPNVGAGLYPVVYGDFRRGYIIVDRIMISFQVDFITGADNGLVVFRGRRRVGGGVRQAEAIKKLKISA